MNGEAVIISFHSETRKFESLSERNKFFTTLHGRKQTIRKADKKYVYHREGLLDEIPHIKVDNSVFIVAMEHMKRMMKFFDEWEKQVDVKTLPVFLDKDEIEELKKKKEVF